MEHDRRKIRRSGTGRTWRFPARLVVSGRAIGVVVGTGAQTELGRINQMLAAVNALETPLLRQIKEFGHTIAKVIGVVSVAGLRLWPMGAGIAFRRGVSGGGRHRRLRHPRRLARADHDHAGDRRAAHGATQRHHPPSSGGGDARIDLEDLFRQDRHADAHGDDGRLGGHREIPSIESPATATRAKGEVLLDDKPAGESAVLKRMGTISALCNDSELRQIGGRLEGRRRSDRGGALSLRRQTRSRSASAREGRRRIDAIPFESEHKFMATLHEEPGGGRMLFVKGAPEVILAHCDRQETESGPEPLQRDYWIEASDRLAAQGERVLGLAWLPDPRFETTSLSPQRFAE